MMMRLNVVAYCLIITFSNYKMTLLHLITTKRIYSSMFVVGRFINENVKSFLGVIANFTFTTMMTVLYAPLEIAV